MNKLKQLNKEEKKSRLEITNDEFLANLLLKTTVWIIQMSLSHSKLGRFFIFYVCTNNLFIDPWHFAVCHFPDQL